MISSLLRFVHRRWPPFEQLTDHERARLIADIALVALSLPLAVIGLAVLAVVSDPAMMRSQWPAALLILALGVSLMRIGFFQTIGTRAGEYSFASATLLPVLAFSALLLFGPNTVWLLLALETLFYLPRLRRAQTTPQYWTLARNWLYNVWGIVLTMLLALLVYRLAGGVIPLPNLSWQATWPAILAVVVFLALPDGLPIPADGYPGALPGRVQPTRNAAPPLADAQILPDYANLGLLRHHGRRALLAEWGLGLPLLHAGRSPG